MPGCRGHKLDPRSAESKAKILIMFKVICTNHDSLPGIYSEPWTKNDPQIGQEYEVEKEYVDDDGRGGEMLWYDIVGFDDYSYGSAHFSRISDIDEVAILEQRRRDYAERMDRVWKGIEREINKMPA